MKPAVLIVDDDRAMCALLHDALGGRDFEVVASSVPEEAFELLRGHEFDAVVSDLNMPTLDGVELCRRIAVNWPNVPVVVITAFGSLETAVSAIRAGAYDFITKPLEVDDLVLTLERALRHRALREEVRRLRRIVQQSECFDEILGQSPPMLRLYDLLGRLAETDVSVLVTGESGTGKELVARAIHRRSARREHPFVAINAAALPAPLLESELFGHVRGAFTGATSDRAGLFARAHGGTLFLDEIGDLPLELQPKLLRVLQERVVRRLGSDAEAPVDVRVVAATNRDLESEVEEGRFRQDLYFRLNVVHVDVPPLRARANDVLMLAQHFLARAAERTAKRVTGLTSGAAEKLLDYAWPGNVRELENCMERAVALTGCERIIVDDLPEAIRNYRPASFVIPLDDPAELVTMEEVERRYLIRVLEALNGNKSAAARVLGLDRTTLYRKMERFALTGRGQ